MRDSFSALFPQFIFISSNLQIETLDCPEFEFLMLFPFLSPLVPWVIPSGLTCVYSPYNRSVLLTFKFYLKP